MDDKIIQSLESALQVTPDNTPLRLTLVRILAGNKSVEDALAYLAPLAADDVEALEDKWLIADLYLKSEQADRALEFCAGDDPKLRIQQALAYQLFGDPLKARTLYSNTIKDNAALETPELNEHFNLETADVLSIGKRGKPKLKVISNDDTDESELGRVLAPPEKSITFNDVGGLQDIKKQIYKRIILPFQKPSLFQRFRRRVGGGILMYGPPGCGKTLLARATAGECKASFFNVEIADILDMYIGESERKLHAIFELARQNIPAVIFFDEVEALGGKRQYAREATSSKLVSQFLSELDGFTQNNSGVLILASTNVPWALDSAFLRPGRFDRMLFMPPPDLNARETILRIQLKDRPVAEKININRLAKQTSGFSGADLQNVVETAVDEAIEDSINQGQDAPITQEHLNSSLEQTRPTTNEWLTTARNYARYSNESGQYNDVLSFLKKHGKS